MVSAEVVTVLAYLHLFRYEALPEGDNQADLQTALELFGTLMNVAPDVVPEHLRSRLSASVPESADDAERLTAEGTRAFNEFLRTGRPEALDVAVDVLRHAVAAVPLGDFNRATALSNLGKCLRVRFKGTGNEADLDAAIDAGKQAVAIAPPSQSAGCVSDLQESLLARFERTGDRADLDTAIDAGKQVLAAIPHGHPDLPMTLVNLGAFLRRRFERAGGHADLDAAIEAEQRALAVITPGHPNLAMTLFESGEFPAQSVRADGEPRRHRCGD